MEALAPPVVAVVVAHDPGPWFEEALAAIAAQDYAELSILVLDSASGEDLTERVARVVPTAYVRRFDENRGFGATVNAVPSMVDGADYYLLCHDDVAPFPDLVHLLVEEAFRSNAGIVSPKVVSWDDPDAPGARGHGRRQDGIGRGAGPPLRDRPRPARRRP